MNRIVVLACGNPSRGDDGLGPAFAERAPAVARGGRHAVKVETDFQLQPEHAADLLGQDAVLFVDASVACDAPFSFCPVEPARDRTFTSHAMSPAAVLAAYRDAFGGPPPVAFTLAIRGDAFELGRGVGEMAAARLDEALAFFECLLDLPTVEAWRHVDPERAAAPAAA